MTDRQPDKEVARAIRAVASRPTRAALHPVSLRVLGQALGVAPATLRQRIARGTLPAYRIGPLWVVDVVVAAQVVQAGRGARRAAG